VHASNIPFPSSMYPEPLQTEQLVAYLLELISDEGVNYVGLVLVEPPIREYKELLFPFNLAF